MRILESLSSEQCGVFQNIERKWRPQLERGFFYAEGESVFNSLLKTGIQIFTVLITPELLQKYQSSIEQRAGEIYIAEKSSIEKIIQRKLNQGVIAFAKIPEMPPFKTFLTGERCIVALNRIDHAVNVGSIMRNCAAFGVSAVVFDDATMHPYSWRAIKSSIGSVFHVPVYRPQDLIELLKTLQHHRFMLIAADPSGDLSINDLKTTSPLCLILGNEHRGISPELFAVQPVRVFIPVESVDSLNVAAASAVFLHRLSLLPGDDDHR